MGCAKSSKDWIPDFGELEVPDLPPPEMSFEEYLEFLEENGFWKMRKAPPVFFREEFYLPEE